MIYVPNVPVIRNDKLELLEILIGINLEKLCSDTRYGINREK